jgi:hypothetical protein
MENFTPHPDYWKLPECIRARYTEKEFAWLGDFERRRLMETECYPEPEDD